MNGPKSANAVAVAGSSLLGPDGSQPSAPRPTDTATSRKVKEAGKPGISSFWQKLRSFAKFFFGSESKDVH